MTVDERVAALEAERNRWYHAARKADADAQNLEIELRVARRKIRELQKQIETKGTGKEEPRTAEVQAVFDYWRVTCGHEKARLGVKRAQAVRAMLNLGYSVDDLKEAVDGVATDAFEKDGKRFDDLELVCRNEVKVDDYRDRAQRARERARESATLAERIRAVCGEGQHDPRMGWTIYGCPVCRFHEEGGYAALRVAEDLIECGVCGAGPAEVRDALA